mmetsp:Transcript_384/g.692  ORF Transcript_384/g.692 Transcript_384/m.692 type:complete len:477 (-) Transcript_384:997-2427(-)
MRRRIRVRIAYKISIAFKLISLFVGHCAGHILAHKTFTNQLRLRIQQLQPIVAAWFLHRKQVLIQAKLCRPRILLRHPRNKAFTSLLDRLALFRVILASQIINLLCACFVHHFFARNLIRVFQTHRFRLAQTIKFLILCLSTLKITRIDINDTRKFNAMRALLLRVGEIRTLDIFDFMRVIIGDDNLERFNHGHRTRTRSIQLIARARIQQCWRDKVIFARDADAVTKIAQNGGAKPATAQTIDGQHAWVVPAAHIAVVDEHQQFALRQHIEGQIEARVLPHHRLIQIEHVEQPKIRLASILKLKRTTRRRDPLERVHDAMRIVVRGINAPRVARLGMRRVHDAIRDMIPHVWIRRRKIALHAQRRFALGKITAPHQLKQAQVLGDTAIAIRRWRHIHTFAERVTLGFYLFVALVTHVGIAIANHTQRQFVQFAEIIAGIAHFPRGETHPGHILDDTVDEFLLLCRRIRVVKAEVA